MYLCLYLYFCICYVFEFQCDTCFRDFSASNGGERFIAARGSCFDPLRREDKAPDPLRREPEKHGGPATLLHRSTLSTFGTRVKRGRGRGLRKNKGDLYIRRGTRRTKRTRRTRREEWSS